MAQGVALWAFGKFSDLLDQIQVLVDAGFTIVKAFNKILDAFLQFTIIGDEALDAVQEFVTGSIQTGVDVIQSYDTTDWREDVSCALYCVLKDLGPSWTQTTVDAWIDEIVLLSNPIIAAVFTGFLRSIALDTWRQRARSNDENEGDCDACGCPDDCPIEATWQSNHNFATNNGGFVAVTGPVIPSYGTYTGGAWHPGYLGVSEGAPYYQLQIAKTVTAGHILRHRITYSCSKTMDIDFIGDGGVYGTSHGNPTGTNTIDIDVDETTALLRIVMTTYPYDEAGVDFQLHSWTICGDGTKPPELP